MMRFTTATPCPEAPFATPTVTAPFAACDRRPPRVKVLRNLTWNSLNRKSWKMALGNDDIPWCTIKIIWHVDAVVGFHLCFQGFSKIFVNSVPTLGRHMIIPAGKEFWAAKGLRFLHPNFLELETYLLPLTMPDSSVTCIGQYDVPLCICLVSPKILLFVRCVNTLKHCFHPNIYGKWMDDQPRPPYVSPTPNRRKQWGSVHLCWWQRRAYSYQQL